jgi:hypothetical protein
MASAYIECYIFETLINSLPSLAILTRLILLLILLKCTRIALFKENVLPFLPID